MLLAIPDVLNAEQVRAATLRLGEAEWVDGRVTAGPQSARVKYNSQLPETHPVAEEIGDQILTALQHHPLFISAALPLRVFPPLFNRYEGGQAFGTPRRQRDPSDQRHRAPHPHGPVGDAVPERARTTTTAAN